jgi:hypothetical protein
LGGNSTQYSGRLISFAAWGASLAGLESSFYSAVNAYMTAVATAESSFSGTPYLRFTGTHSLSAGSVLTYEYTQPWTSMAATRLSVKPITASMIFTNVTTSAAFPGYELWYDSSGFLSVRIINNIATPHYIGVKSTVSLADNTWHVVGATYDGSGTAAGVILYVDGVAVSKTTESDTLAGLSITGGSHTFVIGNQTNHTDFVMGRDIGYFSLANVARDAAYMAAHGASTTKETVNAQHSLFYGMTEGAGTSVTDTSANGFTGTLSTSTLWKQ